MKLTFHNVLSLSLLVLSVFLVPHIPNSFVYLYFLFSFSIFSCTNVLPVLRRTLYFSAYFPLCALSLCRTMNFSIEPNSLFIMTNMLFVNSHNDNSNNYPSGIHHSLLPPKEPWKSYRHAVLCVHKVITLTYREIS